MAAADQPRLQLSNDLPARLFSGDHRGGFRNSWRGTRACCLQPRICYHGPMPTPVDADASLQERYAPANCCYGCGPANDRGLRIRSVPRGEEVVCEWTPQP